MCIVTLDDRRLYIEEWASPPHLGDRIPTGEADIHIIRELRQFGGMMGRPRSLSEAEFMDRAAAGKWDSWAVY